MTRVHLVRHGQSSWNGEGRVQGRSDLAVLTDLGREQVRLTAVELASADGSTVAATALLSSPLQRAWESALIIGSALRLEPIASAALVEQGLGQLEGMTKEAALVEAGELDWTDPQARPPGGESLADVADRLGQLLSDVVDGRWGARVVLVSHGDCIRVAAALLTGQPLERLSWDPPLNGSVRTIDRPVGGESIDPVGSHP